MAEKTPTLADLVGDDKQAAETKPLPASILTDAEIAAAKAEARRRVEQSMKDAAMAKLIEEEEHRLKREEGLRTGKADMDEPVDIMIDLAEFCDRITVNGVSYFHGHTYSVPRHVANSLRETMQRTHRHQMEIDGKGLEEAYRRTAPVALSPSGQRPFVGDLAA